MPFFKKSGGKNSGRPETPSVPPSRPRTPISSAQALNPTGCPGLNPPLTRSVTPIPPSLPETPSPESHLRIVAPVEVGGGNTYIVEKGGRLSIQNGAKINLNDDKGRYIDTQNPNAQRMAFDLSVNRFFQVAQLLIPKAARRAIYWWFESKTPLPQNTYPRSLMTLGYGYPVWRPAPKRSDPVDVQKRGVQVGDVGILGLDGSFMFLFNICESRDNSTAWAHGGFRKGGVEEYTASQPGFILRNAAYHLDGDTYYSYKARGAILYLPSALERTDARLIESFRRHALAHGREWYEAAYKHIEDSINGCLYLVTGHDTTSSSLMATHYSLHTVGIKLEPKAEKPGAAQTALAWNENAGSGGVQKNFNPIAKDNISGAVLENQAVFVRGFRIKIRPPNTVLVHRNIPSERMEVTLKRIGLESVSKNDVDIFLKKGEDLPPTMALRLHGGASHDPIVHHTRGGARFPHEELYHPSDVINSFLLDHLYPEATIAVTHDDEWTTLLRPGDEEMLGNGELLKRWIDAQWQPGRNVGIEYYQQPRQAVPHVFVLQDIFFINYGDIYPYEIRWSLVIDFLGERFFVTQGSYRVNSQRVRLARFRQATLRWSVELRSSDGTIVVSRGQRTIGALLAGG